MVKGLQEPQELRTVSSRWILSELTVNFQHHIAYSCKVRKHGMLVYRPTSDVLALLSEAMWKLKNVGKVHSDSLQASTQAHVSGSTEECNNQCVHVDHVNKLILKQIGSYLAKDAQEPFEYDEPNIDKLINNLDLQLWNAVCRLTRSTSEIRGTSKVNDSESPAHHLKKVRQFFLLCTMMFCTDDRCSMPMHDPSISTMSVIKVCIDANPGIIPSRRIR